MFLDVGDHWVKQNHLNLRGSCNGDIESLNEGSAKNCNLIFISNYAKDLTIAIYYDRALRKRQWTQNFSILEFYYMKGLTKGKLI